ncbi:MAG: hypothetical protein KJ938_15510 [Actinobacteria bacterium]|jgi:hypothetical protein|nr:hypothetical protein [Actinomycetota bacterium]
MSVDRRSLVAGTMAAAAATALTGPAAKALPQRSSGRAERPDPMAPARLHRRVRELCDFQPRWAGYRAERQAGAWLARRLRDAGLDVEVDRYTFRKWQLDGWRTTLLSAQGRRVLPSFPIWSTAAGRGTAPLVDVGLGTEPELLARDLTGAVAVVTGKALLNVFASYPDTYHRAAELGAVATRLGRAARRSPGNAVPRRSPCATGGTDGTYVKFWSTCVRPGGAGGRSGGSWRVHPAPRPEPQEAR